MWFIAVNWIGTVGFAGAAIFWTSRYFIQQRHGRARWSGSLGSVGQALMAAGMSILFLSMLFRI
ncbi:DUF5134 domain-containing protein [Mycobacterium intracellulare]|uniref:DUF5134 domain-containing protein n=1 Tax=Mycobacterium intracellulare TaxID=1767 RepID=UPI0039F658D7